MAHAHAHDEVDSNYFLDQICTVAACGAIGAVAVLMFTSGRISNILVPAFWKPVMIAGTVLLVLGLIRAIALWRLAGPGAVDAEAIDGNAAAAHNHHHGHKHSHGHEHGHEHSH